MGAHSYVYVNGRPCVCLIYICAYLDTWRDCSTKLNSYMAGLTFVAFISVYVHTYVALCSPHRAVYVYMLELSFLITMKRIPKSSIVNDLQWFRTRGSSLSYSAVVAPWYSDEGHVFKCHRCHVVIPVIVKCRYHNPWMCDSSNSSFLFSSSPLVILSHCRSVCDHPILMTWNISRIRRNIFLVCGRSCILSSALQPEALVFMPFKYSCIHPPLHAQIRFETLDHFIVSARYTHIPRLLLGAFSKTHVFSNTWNALSATAPDNGSSLPVIHSAFFTFSANPESFWELF